MATVSGALRTVLVNASLTGVGSNIYRDVAPDATAFPYITFDDGVARASVFLGAGKVQARQRTINVHLYQSLTSEDLSLIDSLINALDGADLSASTVVFGCRVVDVQRFVDLDLSVCHHVVTAFVTEAD